MPGLRPVVGGVTSSAGGRRGGEETDGALLGICTGGAPSAMFAAWCDGMTAGDAGAIGGVGIMGGGGFMGGTAGPN